MVSGIKNSTKSALTVKIPYAESAKVIECPTVNKVINHSTFFHCLNKYTTANTIKNKMWS